MYELFLSGQQFSVIDLTKILNTADPRSHIRYLRKAGIGIADYWVNSAFTRHKMYFYSYK